MTYPHISLLGHLFLGIALCGNPIPFADPWIVCYGTVPNAAAGWPIGRFPSQYVTNNVLCAKEYQGQYSLGCVCDGPGAVPECSLENGADPTLFDAGLHTYFTGGWDSFLAWCLSVCTCLPSEEATEFHELSFAQQLDVVHRAVAQDFPPTTGAAIFPAFGEGALSIPGDTDPDDLSVCNGTCVAGANCSGDHCGCEVKSSTYDPRTNTLKYLAGCTFSPSIPGRMKRNEQMPCPCNSTYVSFACCGAQGSIVWEDPDMKLGELLDPEEAF